MSSKYKIILPTTRPKLHPRNWAINLVSSGIYKKDIENILKSKNLDLLSKRERNWIKVLPEDMKISLKTGKTILKKAKKGKDKIKKVIKYLDYNGATAVSVLAKLANSNDHGLAFNGRIWYRLNEGF